MINNRPKIILSFCGIVASLALLQSCVYFKSSENKSHPNEFNFFDSHTERHLKDCPIKYAVHRSVEPIHASGYPGSGNALLESVVAAITGIPSIGDGGRNNITDPPPEPYDYITYVSHELTYANFFPKVIILVRNPLNAIPSLCNFVYEFQVLEKDENHHHQKQASEEYWIKFRDLRFDTEIERWKKTIEYWADHYDSYHRFIVSYEQLTDEYAGPFVTSTLAKFLNETQGVSTQSVDDIPCVWRAVVQDNGSHTHREKLYTAKFTVKQLEKMEETISHLIMKYFNTEFVDLFYNYETMIGHVKSSQEEQSNITGIVMD